MVEHDTPIFGWHKGRIIMTGTSNPATPDLAHQAAGGGPGHELHRAPEVGWWWFGCTQTAYQHIADVGLYRVGTLTTTEIPPTGVHLDQWVRPALTRPLP